ncbi:hypothetical protein F2982_30875 (plasmid) [Rhizobium sp. BG4]|nr:hypothetical protein F2982_30875 [Rhizobium sp. BG4]
MPTDQCRSPSWVAGDRGTTCFKGFFLRRNRPLSYRPQN